MLLVTPVYVQLPFLSQWSCRPSGAPEVTRMTNGLEGLGVSWEPSAPGKAGFSCVVCAQPSDRAA